MVDQVQTTEERTISRSREETIKEAKRIEESLLYSSKGHFAAAHFWSRFHLWVGIPMVVLAALAGAAAFRSFDTDGIGAGICSLVVVVLSSVMTFLNPNEKASAHLNAGNSYDALMNKVRLFWSIDCWRPEIDDVVSKRVAHLSDQKDKLNQNCPQIPSWAYKRAKQGIEAGEGDYRIDKS